ncbi:hypothetical protein BD410DRAFT_242629 [Rickenella mellea]|uniref:Uncharacterized protein n=1 Tax=Rickenella mellea TaxID=50990 RepID=A0A4Y7QPE5_9AGAM|nr:hypothetical protein BD410DRAFT_242629 [Rickenella mellea]
MKKTGPPSPDSVLSRRILQSNTYWRGTDVQITRPAVKAGAEANQPPYNERIGGSERSFATSALLPRFQPKPLVFAAGHNATVSLFTICRGALCHVTTLHRPPPRSSRTIDPGDAEEGRTGSRLEAGGVKLDRNLDRDGYRISCKFMAPRLEKGQAKLVCGV